MRLVHVDPHDYSHKGVPLIQIKAVKVLNEAIAIDPKAATEAMGSGDHLLNPEAFKKFIDHPFIITGQTLGGMPVLSGLGILNGILMTPRFRLYITTEDDNYTFKEAGIYEDLDWKEPP